MTNITKQTWNKEVFEKEIKRQEQQLLKVGFQIERDAKQFCPVKTGRLRSSITTTDEHTDNKYKVIVGTNVTYSPYIEYGTMKMKAQPYLRPAWEKNIVKITGGK